MYANKSLLKLLDVTDYDAEADTYNDTLKQVLMGKTIHRLGGSAYTTHVWGFLEGSESGAPCSLSTSVTRGEDSKYISLNKVTVNLSGTRDKLFVVRDLSSMVNLQKMMYTKQHLNSFTEAVVR